MLSIRNALLAILFVMSIHAGIFAQTASEFSEIWDKEHVSRILPSDMRHKDLIDYLGELRKTDLPVVEVGRSFSNREIFQIEFGKGPLKIFLWSQMHGDEPTATSSLIDLFSILQKNRDKDWVKQIEKTLTIRAVPMLNPDGAEAYTRRNAQGLDINRDARNLKSPEANLLKTLRAMWSPHIGFNLHNQQELTTAGQTYKQAAISFLVVLGDEAKTMNSGHERNRRLVSAMYQALNEFIPGHIGRYGDDWTPTAFGDNFSAWGTPVILIETGALHGKSEMFLVKMNFIAIATALTSLSTGAEQMTNSGTYDQIPNNTSGRLMHVIFRNVSTVDRARSNAIKITDIGANFERRRASFASPMLIKHLGDLSAAAALTEYDAGGFYAVPRFENLKIGTSAEILFYKKDREIDWNVADLEKTFPPDAIFSLGRWVKGKDLLNLK